MSTDPAPSPRVHSDVPLARRLLEPLLLVALVSAVFGSRLSALPVRGEESRWGRSVAQMLETGDWVVPRQQGQVYVDRPPLAMWAMTPLALVRGTVDEITIRLPSVLAVLLTTLLLYAYARTFLSRFGALTVGMAYATMGQVLQLGRLGENEALFTLLVAGSLLVWHYGYLRCWPALAWSAGYSLAALGTLQKGIQAPAYFVAATGLYLLLRRDWRWLLGRWHFLGLSCYAAVLAIWIVPFYLATDLESTIGVWTRTVAHRFRSGSLIEHLLSYPLETFACLLPWSVLLLALLRKSVRQALGKLPPQVTFALTALAVSYPSVWLASHAKGRYYMPLYPCLALLIGWIAQTCATAESTTPARAVWRRFVRGTSLVLVAVGVVLVAASYFSVEALAKVAQPPAFAAIFLLATVLAAAVLFWAARGGNRWSDYVAVTSLAAMLGFFYTGAVVNAEARVANNMTEAITKLKDQLPPDAELVSFGPINHRFAYYYNTFIPQHGWPDSAAQVGDDVTYFCYDNHRGDTPERRANGRGLYWSHTPGTLPFAWEPVAALPSDRNHMDNPEVKVIIGRIVRPPVNIAEQAAPAESHRQ